MPIITINPDKKAEIDARIASNGFPTETILQDAGTGEPVKVVVKNGQVFVGGMEDDETPA